MKERFFISTIYLIILSLISVSPVCAQNQNFEKAAFSLLPKKTLDVSKLGISAFVNDLRYGSIAAQFREVKNVLGIKYVRVLFNWNDQVQSSPSAAPFFGFYDDIASSIPANVEAMVIINGAPSWMSDSKNWINNNPRETFIKLWLEKVVKRYANNGRIKAWQVWNEPDMESDTSNIILETAGSPENYLELIAFANNVIRTETPAKKIVSAATTSINQKYPATLNYNEELLEGGLENFIDILAIHIYSMHLENFYRPGGIISFMKKIKKPVWVTESGEKGVNKQKEYAQRMWPFLFKTFPQIKRLYIYQFTESTPAKTTYGLRNLTPGSFLSDLYLYLKSLKLKSVKKK